MKCYVFSYVIGIVSERENHLAYVFFLTFKNKVLSIFLSSSQVRS